MPQDLVRQRVADLLQLALWVNLVPLPQVLILLLLLGKSLLGLLGPLRGLGWLALGLALLALLLQLLLFDELVLRLLGSLLALVQHAPESLPDLAVVPIGRTVGAQIQKVTLHDHKEGLLVAVLRL